MVIESNPQIKNAVVKLMELSATEKARDLYERREKAKRDIDSCERWAIAKEREIWQNVIANKDKEIARLQALLEK